ncbi:hypothetical protein LR48_Vigan151s000500 [Vigna angularis]|uniref:Uncharacterized protein n=1 Tax=Phaseolus angularis TaxID=3914 RepID=A0A0L9T5P6_PHAAN|nr:hypothetical protein LR48_Vigan151s000500 [Vigna angularis]
MESEKTSKSAKGEAKTTAQRQFTAERHLGTHVGSAEGFKDEFDERSEVGKRWRQKRTQKVQKKTINKYRSAPITVERHFSVLVGTAEVKNAAEGKN